MELLLWILAVVLVIAGMSAVLRREYLWGGMLIIIGFLVGPSGASILT